MRPLLLGKSPEEVLDFIREQLQTREAFYSQARHTIDVNGMDDFEKVGLCVSEIRKIVNCVKQP